MCISWADQEGGGRESGPPPPENHKNIGFLSKTGPNPLKSHKATKTNTHCWVIIGPAAKRHLNDV